MFSTKKFNVKKKKKINIYIYCVILAQFEMYFLDRLGIGLNK